MRREKLNKRRNKREVKRDNAYGKRETNGEKKRKQRRKKGAT